MAVSTFRFKSFAVQQEQSAMKVGTDGILLGAWAKVTDAALALDIGTGTGLIAMMLAQRSSTLHIDAVEVDEATAVEANINVTNSPFAERITVHQQAVQDFAKLERTPSFYELIVSNPPFFTGGVLSEQANRAVVRHTVKLSHQDLLRCVQRLLSPSGRFALILPWMEGLRFQELAQTYQLFTVRRCRVLPRPGQSPNRWLLELSKKDTECIDEEMTIYAGAKGLERSSVFSKLTESFYL